MKDKIKAIIEGVVSQGKLVGSRGHAFRASSSSNASRTDEPGKHEHGVDIGASRNYAHEKAAKEKAEARAREREREVEKRTKEAEQRKKEVAKMASEETNTEKRMKIKNVARPGDPEPTSEKSTLGKTGSIKTKIVEEKPLMSDKNFGLPASLIAAARQIVEKKNDDDNGEAKKMEGGKTEVIIDPETDDKIDEGEPKKKHTTPKSLKDKKLAALAHPKDKITHKDVLVGRGVVKEEEVEQLDEVNHREFGAKGKMHPDMAKGMKVGQHADFYARGSGDKTYGKVTKNDGKSVHLDVKGKAHRFSVTPHLGEETEQLDELEKSKYVDKVRDATDPSYGRGADHIIKKAGKEHGAKFAKDLEGIAYKSHFGRHKTQKSDPLKPLPGTSAPRVTKAGKMHSVDAKTMKDKIRSRLGKHKKPSLPESVELSDEELLRIQEIAKSFPAEVDEAVKKSVPSATTVVSAPLRGANQDYSGVGTKSSVADYTISDSAKFSNRHGDLTKKKVKEEVELEEGRGRPRKNPLPAGKEAEGDDTHKHPMQQLEKISHAIEGNEPHFEHKDGSKSKIGKHLAKHIVAIHNSMRTTQEKDNFAQKVHANRDSLRSEVSKHF